MTSINKTFIISSGRAGSTLCGALLATAGANFGVEDVKDWDKKAGAYELKEIGKASEHHSREVNLKKYSHISLHRMWHRKYHRYMAKRYAERAFIKADFFKLSNSTLARMAKKQGYHPKLIILYRPFPEYNMSSFLRSGRQYPEMRNHFYQTYTTGMLALNIYGGCVITYEEMITPDENAWISRVSEVTGLAENKLKQSRDELIESRESKRENYFRLPDPELDNLEEAIYKIRDRVISADRLAERSV